MLDSILNIALLAAIVAGFVTYHRTKNVSRAAPVAGQSGTGPRKATAPAAPAPSLEVPGAIHPGGPFGFLKLFGLGKFPVQDFCFIPGPLTKEKLNPHVTSALQTMHVEGDAVGPALMEFLHHGRPIAKDESLCFVLQAMPFDAGSRVVAFVDKLRHPVPAA